MEKKTQPRVMHIHFWADIRNSAGSVEKVITALAAHGHDWTHEIACCLPRKDKESNHLSAFDYHGVRVNPFIESGWRNRIFNKCLRMNYFSYPALVKLIEERRPDLLHFHNRQEKVDQVMNRLTYRPKVVVHYHRHFSAPVIPRTADLLVYPSETTKHYIEDATLSKVRGYVLLNPLSIEALGEGTSCNIGGKPIGCPPVILYGGGNNPIKGLSELIEAFRGMTPGCARLVLAGRGVERLGINDPDIDVLGEIPAQTFLARLEAADIVVMPSYNEPFGLIAQEAMLLGTLMIVSNTGGLAEFTGDDCAITVPPRDTMKLRIGLQRALSLLQDGQITPLLENARKRVMTLTPEKVVERLESAYSSIEVQGNS